MRYVKNSFPNPAGLKNWNKPGFAARGLLLVLCFALGSAFCYAQNRGKMPVYVSMPTGGTAAQRSYFYSSFRMELIGANYPAAKTAAESLFTLALDIEDNPEFDSESAADDDNGRYLLDIRLKWSKDDNEIVRYSFPFNDIESMSDWNLYLLYQAMANAPVPEDEPITVRVPVPVDTRWRNQTLYLNLALGVDSGHFINMDNRRIDWGIFMPATLAGLEWHFSDHLSLELDPVKPQFLYNGNDFMFGTAFSLLFKGVLKPDGIMLEPYTGVEYTQGIIGGEMPPLSVLAGMQMAFRAGERSAWTMDAGVSLSALGAFRPITNDLYNVLRVYVLWGWKLGFIEKPGSQKIF